MESHAVLSWWKSPGVKWITVAEFLSESITYTSSLLVIITQFLRRYTYMIPINKFISYFNEG